MKAGVVEIRNLTHAYMSGTPQAQTALDRVNLDVREGETLALIGATGSGKSTLLQHINGLYVPREGGITVLGRDLADPKTDLRQLRREVGLVFQNPEDQIFEPLVGDDIAYGPRMGGLSGRELTRRVRWAMEVVGLDFGVFKDRPAYQLSGGERRKVGLAGVIALKPRILLLDEPTAGLDPEAHDDLLSRLAGLKEEGMTLVVATHNMDDVAYLADRVLVLHEGKIVLQGKTRSVFSRISELRSYGLDVPTYVSFVAELKDQGWDICQDVLSLEEAEAAVLGAVEARRSKLRGEA